MYIHCSNCGNNTWTKIWGDLYECDRCLQRSEVKVTKTMPFEKIDLSEKWVYTGPLPDVKIGE